MKKTIQIVSILSVVLFLGLFLMSYNQVNNKHNSEINKFSKSKTAIYYVPHQDDETLSMSVDILNSLKDKKKVILILYTNGVGSVAQKIINGKKSSSYWKDVHDPVKEGYKPLTDKEFSEARNREFICASLQLGVKIKDLVFTKVNNKNKIEDLKNLILSMEKKFPNAVHSAMSYYDTHSDHSAGGKALNELYKKRMVSNAKFFISRNDWQKKPGIGLTLTADAEQKKIIGHAIASYAAWNPISGSFAVGYHSVHNQFISMLNKPQNKVHFSEE